MTNKSITIRIVDSRQSKRPSWFSAFAVCILIPGALFWPGVLTGSAAMQWAGFIAFILITFAMLGKWTDEFLTCDEARNRIDEIEGVEAKKHDR